MQRLNLALLVGVAILSTGHFVSAGRILAATFFATPSHRRVYDPLLSELANRGHQITVISPVVSSMPNPKIREIPGIAPDSFKFEFFELRIQKQNTVRATDYSHVVDPICRQTYNLPEVRKLFNETFDLVITSAFLNECVFGLIHHLKAPLILTSPLPLFCTTASFFGVPTPSSFVPSPTPTFSSTQAMNFVERAQNFITNMYTIFAYESRIYGNAAKIYRDVFGNHMPSVQEIGRSASLVFINSHFSLNYPRPMMPDMIEIGGMHCRPAQPLPKELDDYMNGAEHGVIYFSFGTIVLGSQMPESIRKMFVGAFSKLKQRVLWKWETEEMPDLPSNVKLSRFFPQQDVLAHTKTRLFITHGGLLSTEEAIYHGVPLIGVPFFADQDWNMKLAETAGVALTLELGNLTETTIYNSINRILSEPIFQENTKMLSAVFKDRPINPLKTAVYWSEYVLRHGHNTARHLRSSGRDLNFFQYYCLDVMAALGSFALVCVLVASYIVKFVVSLLPKLFRTGGNANACKLKEE